MAKGLSVLLFNSCHFSSSGRYRANHHAADEHSRTKVLDVFSDLTRAFIMLVIPICYFNGFSPLWFIILLMLIHSATGASYDPASVSIIPKIVKEDLIQKANAVIQSSGQIVKLAAVTLCGAMIVVIGAAYTMLIILPLYMMSAFLVLLITYHTKAEEAKAGGPKQQGTYLKKLKRGFALVRQHHILFPLAVYCIF